MRRLITSTVLVLVMLSIGLPLLKICNSTWVATWSWFQVATPVWGMWALALVGMLLYGLVRLVTNVVNWPT